jgi:hypothetical protein
MVGDVQVEGATPRAKMETRDYKRTPSYRGAASQWSSVESDRRAKGGGHVVIRWRDGSSGRCIMYVRRDRASQQQCNHEHHMSDAFEAQSFSSSDEIISIIKRQSIHLSVQIIRLGRCK